MSETPRTVRLELVMRDLLAEWDKRMQPQINSDSVMFYGLRDRGFLLALTKVRRILSERAK